MKNTTENCHFNSHWTRILHRRVIVMFQGHWGGSKVYPQSLLRTNETVIKAVLNNVMAVFAAVLSVFIKAVI